MCADVAPVCSCGCMFNNKSKVFITKCPSRICSKEKERMSEKDGGCEIKKKCLKGKKALKLTKKKLNK